MYSTVNSVWCSEMDVTFTRIHFADVAAWLWLIPRSNSWATGTNDSPDEGAEAGRTQSHGSFDTKEAQEDDSDALHDAQVIKLLGVFREDLLQTQRWKRIRQAFFLITSCLHNNSFFWWTAPCVWPVATERFSTLTLLCYSLQWHKHPYFLHVSLVILF